MCTKKPREAACADSCRDANLVLSNASAIRLALGRVFVNISRYSVKRHQSKERLLFRKRW